MLATSNEYKLQIDNLLRVPRAYITIGGTSIYDGSHLIEIKISEFLQGKDKIFGNSTSKMVKISVSNPANDTYIIENGNLVNVYIGITLNYDTPTETIEYIHMGEFIITNVEKKDTDFAIEIEAYDKMIMFNKPFAADINFPITLGAFVSAIAARAGVSYTQSSFTNSTMILTEPINAAPNEYTLRECLEWAGELSASNAIISQNKLVMKEYSTSVAATITPDNYQDLTIGETQKPLNVLALVNNPGEDTLYHPSVMPNPINQYMIDTNMLAYFNRADIIAPVFAAIEGHTHKAYRLKWRGRYELELGDLLEIEDYDGGTHYSFLMNRELTFDGSTREELYVSVGGSATADLTKGTSIKEVLRNTSITIDKINQTIETVVQNVDEQGNIIEGFQQTLTPQGITQIVEQNTTTLATKTYAETQAATAQANSIAHANTAATNAENAAKAYAEAEAEAKAAEAQAAAELSAQGYVSAETAARVADTNAKLTEAKTYADTQATAAENAAKAYAEQQAQAAELTAKAYTDTEVGIVDVKIDNTNSVVSQQAGLIASKVATTTFEAEMLTKEGVVYKQTTAPTHQTGRLWIDTSEMPNILYRSDGTAWIKASPTEASEVGAFRQSDGSALLSRMSTAETAISQTSAAIQLAATKQEVSTLKTNVEKYADDKATEAETAAKGYADGIVSSVSSRVEEAMVAIEPDNIVSTVLNSASFGSEKTDILSSVEQTAGALVLNLEETIRDEYDETVKNVNSTFKFTEDGLNISRAADGVPNPMNLNLSSESIQFRRGTTAVAEITPSEMTIGSAKVATSIQVGVHQILKHNSNVTIITWVGE